MTKRTNTINLLNDTKTTSQKLKEYYDSPFWRNVRSQAESKLKKATRNDGTLIWDKLPNLLSVNPKIIKGEKLGYKSAILHLAPSWASGINTCALATLGCGMNCLNESGHGQLHMINNGSHHVHIARVIRTLIWFKYRDQFKTKIQREIESLQRKATLKESAIPVVRPNGTSDQKFESLFPELFTKNPQVTFYDYSKIANRNVSHIPNYSLVYSMSEDTTESDIESAFNNGMNCVVVLRLKRDQFKPESFMGRPMIDGDSHDLRFIDPQGVFVGLFAKGHAYKDTSGFVYELETTTTTQEKETI